MDYLAQAKYAIQYPESDRDTRYAIAYTLIDIAKTLRWFKKQMEEEQKSLEKFDADFANGKE